MFKIFQSKEKQSTEVAVIEKPIRKYSKEIEQVHHEFEIASELLYAEAVEILTNNKINNPDKINRLRDLGFCAVKEVVEVAEKEEKTKLSQQTIDFIQKYKREYPLNKFITIEQVETICGKYGLAYGEIARFYGFVPEKNLKDIEQFSSKYKFKSATFIPYSSDRRYDGEKHIISIEDAIITSPDQEKGEHGFLTMGIINGKSIRMQQQVSGWDGYNFYGSMIIDGISRSGRICINTLSIAAPQKDFNMQGMTVKKFQITKEVPDPVVLQPIKGGFLIVTAWGDEASDPIVMNELNN